jgi:hypothetical protein
MDGDLPPEAFRKWFALNRGYEPGSYVRVTEIPERAQHSMESTGRVKTMKVPGHPVISGFYEHGICFWMPVEADK